jgi:hypothetical protein
MSDIRFACPHCNQHIACDADYSDSSIECPACGSSMVVPRLSAGGADHSGMVLVASTPSPKHTAPERLNTLRGWTEEEWAQHSRMIGEGNSGEAPHWVLSLVVTIIISFILRINHAGAASIITCLVLGAAICGVLMAKQRRSAGAYVVLKGVGIVVALCLLLPVVSLAILFIGCMACR